MVLRELVVAGALELDGLAAMLERERRSGRPGVRTLERVLARCLRERETVPV
jgi:hypothetical protein